MRFQEQVGQEIVKHRKARVGHQNAMQALTGMKTQQYNRLENGADVRLSTLFRVIDALELEMALVPRDRMLLVDMILNASDSQLEEYKQFMLQQLQYEGSSTASSSVTGIEALMQDLSDE
ncbi:MAG: helix-turn-helix domain-containing protein [Neptuniibacter sp.]